MNKLIAITFLMLTTLGWSQDDLYDHGLDQNKWQDIREGIRYEGREGAGRPWTYESKEDYQKEVERYRKENGGSGNGNGGGTGGGDNYNRPKYKPRSNYKPPSSNASLPSLNGLGVFGYVLLGVFGIGLIILIFYLFINTEQRGAKVKPTDIDFEEINPTEIPLTELQKLLQEALAKNDYRGAVRIYFIFIIRDLAEKGWINWEKEKTNMHYLREMTGKKEYDDFNLSVSYFEVIWYGKRDIDAAKFEQIKPKFTRFLDKLGVK